MNITGQRVLVTGGGGFIGSHLLQQLLHSSAEVRALVHYNSWDHRGFIDTLPEQEQEQIEIVKGDLRDAYTVMKAVKGIDVVFHLGALIAIPYSYLSPADVFQTNVFGTMNLAEAALKAGVQCFIHTSTSEVYGSAKYVPMDESHPLQGQSPYSASKIAADKVVESFYCSYDLPVKIVRPFNAYGPRQSMRAVIPTIINQALHCAEIRLGNLSTTRDFTFVQDTARAFLLAAQADSGFGEVFNAGSGYEISIGELVHQIQSIIGCNRPVKVMTNRQRVERSEVNRLWSNSQKAEQVLGWKPMVTLQEGLARTVEWMKANSALYRPHDYIV